MMTGFTFLAYCSFKFVIVMSNISVLIVSILRLVTETYPSQTRTTASHRVKQTHILSFEENAEALVHRRLVLGSVSLAFLQRLDGAELSCEPLEQGLLNMERLEHSFVD